MNLFLVMMQGGVDWPATAGMLGVIVGGSGIVGGLIGALICKPMIEAAMGKLVSREIFDIYVRSDERDHAEMKNQLSDIWDRLNQQTERDLRLPQRFE